MGGRVTAMATILETPGKVLANTQVDSRLWLLDVEAPDVAARIQPGQFVHVLIPRMEGHVLRRPFSVFYVSEDARTLTILYQVVGFGSKHMTTLVPGDELSIMGPIGHGWQVPEGAKRALLVAGGVGGAPLFMHAAQLLQAGLEVEVVLGAQTKSALAVLPKYTELLGAEPLIATDDGSYGFAGYCTELAAQRMEQNKPDYVACCGPEPVMHIVSDASRAAGIPTAISLEKRMACGIGACLSCIVETVDGRKRSCVDGPVFDASKVVW